MAPSYNNAEIVAYLSGSCCSNTFLLALSRIILILTKQPMSSLAVRKEAISSRDVSKIGTVHCLVDRAGEVGLIAEPVV